MTPKVVISIGRQYGSGGRILGSTLAKRFDIKFYDNDIIYSTQNSSDKIVFGGINDKINNNIIGKIANLNCNIDTIFENNIDISCIKLVNNQKDFNDSQKTFTAEFKYDVSKIKWVLYSNNKIVKQESNNFPQNRNF